MTKYTVTLDVLNGRQLEFARLAAPWNGFASPSFTLEQGKEVLAAMQDAYTQLGMECPLRFDADRQVFQELDVNDYDGAVWWDIDPTPEGLHPIGAWAWAWEIQR